MMAIPGDQPAPSVPKVSPWPGVGLTLALHGAVALLLLAVKGLIIGASLTFLLNALCFGVVFAMFATGGVSMR